LEDANVAVGAPRQEEVAVAADAEQLEGTVVHALGEDVAAEAGDGDIVMALGERVRQGEGVGFGAAPACGFTEDRNTRGSSGEDGRWTAEKAVQDGPEGSAEAQAALGAGGFAKFVGAGPGLE